MKKAFVLSAAGITMAIIFLAVLGVSPALSESPTGSEEAAASSEKTAGAPRIVFEETEYDFGTLGQEETVKHNFKFRNEGDAVLVIGDIKTTCGCTGTLLSKKEIAPSEEGFVEVSFHSGRSGGKRKKSIFVNSNDPKQPSYKLDITVNVLVPVEVRPRTLYWVAERNEESARTIELVYKPGLKMNIEKLEISSPSFTALAVPKKNPETPGYDINVKYDGKLPIGNFQHKLVILTDNQEHPKLQVDLRGKVVGPVKVIPDAVALGVVKDNYFPSRTIRVYDTSKGDFEITGVESSSPIIKVEYTKEEASNKYEVKVALTAEPPKGAFSERLFIKTNNPTVETIEVPVYAFVK